MTFAPAPFRVCFVCSGNICRSPTAEVVLLRLVDEAGLAGVVEVDSAGTGGWHVGEDMDARSRATLAAAGYDHPRHAAGQFEAAMFDSRDLVVALDSGHHEELWDLAGEAADPSGARQKIVLLRSFDPTAQPDDLDVADPYYGARDGFDRVLAQVERACAGLLAHVTEQVPVAQQTERPPL